MIIYFSGTGNSQYVAKKIKKETNYEILNLFEKVRNNDYSPIISNTPWILVAPTYAWRIPLILHKWLTKTKLNGNQDIYFVMTCAGSNGYASKYLKELCENKGMNYKGCIPIIMPNNYIALSKTPNKKDSLKIIEKEEQKILNAVSYIKKDLPFPENHITLKDKLNSGILNDIFYSVFVHSKKFYATNKCISCGKCENVCPLKNIHLKEGKPIWGNNCTHCMACICSCPKAAIEYGKHTKNRERYICPM